MDLGGRFVFLLCGLALLGNAPAPTVLRAPSVEILEPAADATVAGPDLRVRVRAEGVELGSRGRNGAHVLLKLDAMPAMKSYGERFTFRGVADGEHTLKVELRRPDGAAFDPAVTAEVTFTVRTTATIR